MDPIILPIDKSLLSKELKKESFVCHTSRGNNKIYDITAATAPHVMQEIGRLREMAFRAAGGGTGQPVDIDDKDLSATHPYHQLVVWDPRRKEILGGYRYLLGSGITPAELSSASIFSFSPQFVKEILPYTIELGRSFVQPNYQNSNDNRIGLYALDNLWDGLGALIVRFPQMKYFFGKVTMYRHYNTHARSCLMYFLTKYFPDPDQWVRPTTPLQVIENAPYFAQLFSGEDYEANYRILTQELKAHGEHIPPLINSYMRVSPSMRVFGTTLNPHFGDVEETGILLTIAHLYPGRVGRHINPLRAFTDRLKLHWWRHRHQEEENESLPL